jgi:hypothetical protein
VHPVRIAALSLCAACVSLATTHASRACEVLAPDLVLPASPAAPLNAHLWIVGLPIELNSGASLSLVSSPGAPAAPAFDLRAWEGSVLLEVVPRAPLAAGTRYELWASPRKAPWEPAGRPRHPPVLLGTFRTGTDVDVTPPSAPVLVRAVRRPAFASCSASLGIEVATPATDPQGGAVLYAVWFASADGRVAYEVPPDAIAPYAAETRSLELEDPAHALVGLHLGVRALDLAGNLGPPAEVTVVGP